MQLSQQQQLSLLAAPFGPAASQLPLHFPSLKEGVSYTKRIPNCQKCGVHNRKARLKGHKRVCPFKDCNCTKCQVVTERQKLMADQIKARRRQRKDTALNRQKLADSLNSAALAGQLPFMNMFYNQLNTQPAEENNNEQQQAGSPELAACPISTISPTAFPGLPTAAPALGSLPFTSTAAALPQQTGVVSPLLASSPLSTIGTEMSLSPLQPRALSFDLGVLNSGASGPTSLMTPQVLSSLVAAQAAPAVSQAASPTALNLTPPQSAGLIAPIPINPLTTTAASTAAPPPPASSSLGIDQLAQLIQLLCQQQQTTQLLQQQLLPFVSQAAPTPQQPSINDLLLISGLMPAELSPPPEGHSLSLAKSFPMAAGVSTASLAPKTNGFVDVCSV
ncbi:Doublesex-and mab-3-related transcription factor 3 [Aphelenchoides fujianensis]|nr:Doublesex-and mab-3-related transcription factor 3 [Aphelenchoides fujianensis]